MESGGIFDSRFNLGELLVAQRPGVRLNRGHVCQTRLQPDRPVAALLSSRDQGLSCIDSRPDARKPKCPELWLATEFT